MFITLKWLNFHFYLFTLQAYFHKTVAKSWSQLLQLGGYRAIGGVDHNASQTVIDHPGMFRQARWHGCRKALAQLLEQAGMSQYPGSLV